MSKLAANLLVLSLILALAGSILAFDPMFDGRIDYAVRDYPFSVFSIDLDGDGDNDLAVANAGSNNVE